MSDAFLSLPEDAITPKVYDNGRVNLYSGDCFDVLRMLPDNSVDSIVTDPPYGLSQVSTDTITEVMLAWLTGDRGNAPEGAGFMGKAWDAFVPPPAVWDECFRVLKPGGHVLAFSGSRTYDLMGLSIRLAGFEIRDGVAWLYGTGFPKSLDIAKAIDKAAGVKKTIVDSGEEGGPQTVLTDPVTDEAKQWEGWGTALKPAFEPVVVARKPLIGTVIKNVLEHGTGAMNIAGCRVGNDVMPRTTSNGEVLTQNNSMTGANYKRLSAGTVTGRFPSNIILDESQAAVLDEQSGLSSSPPIGNKTKTKPRHSGSMSGAFNHDPEGMSNGYGDEGGASRFFYVAKASKKERPIVDGIAHPTVKPLSLMRWLIRLVTPVDGVVLEPFAGSGTTVEAAIQEGFRVIGIERDPHYLPLIEQRIQRSLELTDDEPTDDDVPTEITDAEARTSEVSSPFADTLFD